MRIVKVNGKCLNKKLPEGSFFEGGEVGIRTLGRILLRQPLSRRPQSSTLAPPQIVKVFAAEEVGFEPTLGFPKPVFKTGAFNRSAIPPQSKYSNTESWLIQAFFSQICEFDC